MFNTFHLYLQYRESKKLCKKLKISPTPSHLKHYKDGEFHKDYDRQILVASIVNFMREPTGDLPWEEDPVGADVVHVQDAVVYLCLFLLTNIAKLYLRFIYPKGSG